MMLLLLLLSLITTSLADCSFRFNGGAYITLQHDSSHFLPAQSSFISFDFWIRPRKFSRSITAGQDTYKYIIQTGKIHDLWSWEIRIQETPFGSILIYEYWERDDSLVWNLKHSYSSGEYTLPDRQWSHVWYSANESITYINYLPVKLVNQNITYSKTDPNQYFKLGDRFTGSMDEVRIWNNAYIGDIRPLSNTTLCPADYISKSAMYFTFNECSGGEVTELVSNWCATIFHHKMQRNSRPEWDLLSPIVTLPCTKTSKCYAESVPQDAFLMGVEIGELVVFLIPSIILLCLIGFKLKSCLQAKRNSYTFLKKKQTKRQNQEKEVDPVQISQPVSYQPLEPYQVISPPFYVPPQATFHVYDPNDENVVIVV